MKWWETADIPVREAVLSAARSLSSQSGTWLSCTSNTQWATINPIERAWLSYGYLRIREQLRMDLEP